MLPAAESGIETWVVRLTGEKLRRLEWNVARIRAVPGLDPATKPADGVVFYVVGSGGAPGAR